MRLARHRRLGPLPQFVAALLLVACAAFPALAQHTTSKNHHTSARHKSVHKSTKAAAKPAAKASVKVWVNTKTGVYHYPGARWYGTTKVGEYMNEDAARKAGYRSAENGQ